MLVSPLVEDLKVKREERMKQFSDMKAQIDKISVEISGDSHLASSATTLESEEQDLSLRKLTEYQTHLRALQKEKVSIRNLERFSHFIDFIHYMHLIVTFTPMIAQYMRHPKWLSFYYIYFF